MIMASNSVHAQATDTKDPVLAFSTAEGRELRNTTDILLNVTDDNPASASIAVTHLDGTPVSVDGAPLAITTTQASTAAALSWPTRKVADGQYKINYSATDAFGNVATSVATVGVINEKPLVTITDPQGRGVVAGIVSRDDVTFRVLINGQEQTNLHPVVVSSENNEAALWSFKMPEGTPDGNYAVDVYATAVSGVQSDRAFREITLSPEILFSPAEIIKEQATTPSLPRIEFAEQIGEFIAPVIPQSFLTAPAKLFGVPVDDIVQDSPTTANKPAATPIGAMTVGTARQNSSTDGGHAIVQASESGWKLFGISWYWVTCMIIALVVTAIWTIRSTRARARRDDTVFANA